jgi:regulatory protein
MKIIKYKKLSKGRYKVTFDSTELILYEEVIFKNELLLTKDITLDLLNKIIKENKYYEAYNIALTYIEIKMRTEKEVRDYLYKKDIKQELINKVIEKLNIEGYLNEKKYIEAYVNDKQNLTSEGPYKIKRKLLDLELKEELIDEYLSQIPYETWKEKLSKIIEKRLKMMKNKSLYTIKTKLKIDLFNLGYQSELIEELINKIEKNDNNSLKKEYEKALNKYSKKYSGTILENYLKNYLYKKGYNIEDINNIIEENK